jgi:hypothetical protein
MTASSSNVVPKLSIQSGRNPVGQHLSHVVLGDQLTAVNDSEAATRFSDLNTHYSQLRSHQFRTVGRRRGSLAEIAKQAFHQHLYEKRRQTEEKIKHLVQQIR